MKNTLRQTMKRPSALTSLGYLCAALLMAGCGYSFAGRSEAFPNDIRTVYIEPFINQTRNVGLEKELTSALRSEFYRRGQLRVVDTLDQADGIVAGVVRSFDSHVASVNRYDEVLQYETAMVVDASLRRREPNEIIWRTQGTRLTDLSGGSRAAVVTSSSEFKTRTLDASDVRRLTDIQLTETENRAVRGQLVERFARELHQRLMEMF
ncbi:MAG TPA: LptE family protein [Candidatus Binatia bacterium]|nr:LptE family protein [Candidatus Binatia bacterium]